MTPSEPESYLERLFGLDGRAAVVTGGSGVLGGAIARGLALAGARVAVLARRREPLDAVVESISQAGGEVIGVEADVTERSQLESACETLLERWGRVDVLVNAAGGNIPEAIVSEARPFFDLSAENFERVLRLNLLGTVLPSQVFARAMSEGEAQDCSIVNISSLTARRPASGVVAYAAAKAGVDNFTRWLAVELARRYGGRIRVNAIAPGFFLGEQNRALLVEPDGNLTERGESVIRATPAGRFGAPEELVPAVLWLAGASFVTGTVVTVDGGMDANLGV
ncbi:MAG: SDR family oxidoreductase [Gaiellaceae bacterium]|jgi:NAD(P)-dependent dehydrogenase (short-subunit alcohol dehydrogenase family)